MNLFGFAKKRVPAQESFDALLESNLDGLYRVALRYTRDASLAEDLVHDTAMRALRFRDRFEPGTNFKAWIYTILTNTFIHRYRRHKKERMILDGSTREDVQSSLGSETARLCAEDPEHAYLDHMLSDDVLAALDALPEDFRMVVVLCDIEGLSYKEIADVLGCPVGTVMSRLYRGRRILEQALAGVAAAHGIVKAKVGGDGHSVTHHGAHASEPGSASITNMMSYKRRKSG